MSASDLAISVRGLSKAYTIHHNAERHQTLAETVLHRLRDPFRRSERETFWALKDVSFNVNKGEIIGIIGRNGAGKSTLLKIMSRITEPSSGEIDLYGRIGSLLEVGTGFHPELTGRENTYLSGSILGMSKREIDRKFDEIVAFAEIEKFIDTAVKHYSTGMYMRLAFSVAAHLEPEILLVDEVLAVGDINFQKKCLGKMGEVAKAGRTVVLVSHQLAQIRRLCERVAWVDGGHVRQSGPTHQVVSAYESAMGSGDITAAKKDRSEHAPASRARFVRWEILEPSSNEPHVLNSLEPVTVQVTVDVGQALSSVMHGIALYNHDRQLIWCWGTQPLNLNPGKHHFRYSFPMLPLRPGPYAWLVTLYKDGEMIDSWDCIPEMIVTTELYQFPQDEWIGFLNIPTRFEMAEAQAPVAADTGKVSP